MLEEGQGIPHNVLNARYHEQEAVIVADAGVPGAVTIATNMAGRGTDIQLGGNVDMRVDRASSRPPRRAEPPADPAEDRAPDRGARSPTPRPSALAAGGLFVLGTERHESRRIDNQLRGRTGRQGDPGHSKFFLSCEDDLLRIFAGERLDSIMRTFGVQEGEAITHQWLNSASPPPRSGRAAQLRDPQEPAEVRRRRERPAQGGVRAAPRVHGGDRPVRDRRRDAPARHRGPRRPPPAAQGLCRAVGRRGPRRRGARASSASTCRSTAWAAEEGVANEEIRERLTAGRRRARRPSGRALRSPRPCARSRSSSCCR